MPRRTAISHILIIGGGPIATGPAARFEHSWTAMMFRSAMKSVTAALFLLAAPLHAAACSPAAPADPGTTRIAQLREMTKRCDVADDTLALLGPDEVTIAAGPEVQSEKVECLIDAIKKAEPKLQYMFMGNAPYETEDKR